MFDRHLHFYIPSSDLAPPSSDWARMEYAKLWMEQSKLMWSRLQFIHLVHVAVLGSWFYLWLETCPVFFQVSILFIGLYVSQYIDIILQRDAAYMDKLRDLSIKAVPELTILKEFPNGSMCATRILCFLCILEVSMIIAVLIAWTAKNGIMIPDFP